MVRILHVPALWLLLAASCNEGAGKPPKAAASSAAHTPTASEAPGKRTQAPSTPAVVDVRGKFQVQAPVQVQHEPRQGDDSLVGMLTFQGCELHYDFGGFSSSLTEEQSRPNAQVEAITVGGASAKLVSYVDSNNPRPHWVGLHVPTAPQQAKLTIYGSCSDETAAERAKQLLRSVTFTSPLAGQGSPTAMPSLPGPTATP